MTRWAVCALFALIVATRTSAQDAPEASRAHFERGVQAAEAEHWSEAAAAFEAALADADRPVIRYNLVLAYEALGRAADVERHALAFLAFPDEPHRAEARRYVEEALQRARAATAQAVVPVTPRPPEPPSEPLAPQTIAPAAPPLVVLPPPALTALPSELPPPRWRTRLAWSFGIMGASLAAASVVSYAVSAQRAAELRRHDPYVSGFLSSSDAYLRSSNAITPLALGGAALMAAAVPLGPQSTHQRSSAWAWASLALATAATSAGIALASVEPARLGDSRLREPTRYAGAMLLGAALPLFSYTATFALRRRAERRDRAGWQALRGQP